MNSMQNIQSSNGEYLPMVNKLLNLNEIFKN